MDSVKFKSAGNQKEDNVPSADGNTPLGVAPGILAKRNVVKNTPWCPPVR